MKLELAVKLQMKTAKQPPALNSDLVKALEKLVKATFKVHVIFNISLGLYAWLLIDRLIGR